MSVTKCLYACIKTYAYKYQPYTHNQMDYDKGLFTSPLSSLLPIRLPPKP